MTERPDIGLKHFLAPVDNFLLEIKTLHLTPTNICCSLVTGSHFCFTANTAAGTVDCMVLPSC